jgi:predicted ATPase/class 3 adenylate cyclase
VASPPTGTVTFLFTDIEDSTKLWERSPQAMQAALVRHDEILRRAIEDRGGYVFKTVGDAFCCAFPTAPDALEAALESQRLLLKERWGESTPLRVRMALHMGTAEERDEDYFGPPVNRVARLLSAAHGGQVLLSLPTHEMVRDQLPAGMSLAELGEHRLKDLFRPERVFQLSAPGLPVEFPPLRTLDTYRNNLPLQPTPLVGREKEVSEVCDLLRGTETRLLTLTGPGGTGKTRLALQAAADLLDDFPDGTFFVPLATLSEAELFLSTVAETLGVRETGEQPLDESLKDYLKERRLLLVLDNFEQVLGAAPTVTELLAAAPGLKVLATSRAPLGLYGEHEYAVPPLSVPDVRHLPDFKTLSQYEAVRLFIERAKAAKADFEVTDESAPAVAEICVRLDGLPLAIELAAARIKMLPPKAMLQRLSSRLKLLTGGARDLPVRQRTLRGAIEWSHTLLGDGEKTLFARMAVFSGGRTLEAVEAVCDAQGDLPVDSFEGVSSLLDKSLLRQEEGPEGEPRFVMLETIHEYAREKLQESGEAEVIGRAHTEYFLALAEEAEPELVGTDQVSWMDVLEAEHDNLRAALSRSLEAGDSGSALRIGGALWRFWNVRGHFSEGRRWLTAGLSGEGAAALSLRARASLGLGYLELRQGDYPRAVEDLEVSHSLYREIGDRRGEAYALCFLGWIALDRNEFDRAEELLEESLALSRAAGTARDVSVSLNALAMLKVYRGDHERATAMQEECLSLAREAGDVQIIAVLTYNLGFTAAMTGEYERAEAFVREAQALFREVGDRGMAPLASNRLGFLALSQDDPDRAEELCVEAIRDLQEQAQIPGIDFALEILGGVAASRGEIRRAAQLWGAVAGYRDATGAPWIPEERAMIEAHIDAARPRLEEATWREEWEKGRSMTLDQAVEYALEEQEVGG